MVSPLQAAVDFLKSFGFFDIVLPFILVFTIVYAILDKTKILGKEDKKNVNALVAFAFGLFVVAATNIVDIFKDALPIITLVLIVLLSFMILVGAFHMDKEFSFAENVAWRRILTIIMFVAVILIFMNFIEADSGNTWLEEFWDYVSGDFDSGAVVSSILFLAIIIFVVWFVGYGGKNKEGG
jgi:hypothetical protein